MDRQPPSTSPLQPAARRRSDTRFTHPDGHLNGLNGHNDHLNGAGDAPSADPPDEPRDANDNSEVASACTGCRRRKLKCSKEVPKCQQCRKTGADCAYDNKRSKPGMKAGAIEGLHRRLDALETRVQNTESSTTAASGLHDAEDASSTLASPDVYNVLSFFARELKRFNDGEPQHNPSQKSHGSAGFPSREDAQDVSPRTTKRQKTHPTPQSSIAGCHPPRRTQTCIALDERGLNALLKAYFSHVHPWIPMVHEGRLRRRMSQQLTVDQQQRLHMLLLAMKLASARFIEEPDVVETPHRDQSQIRDEVILQATKSPSVESLQALVVLAFHDIGGGEASLVWSIIGSLTRTAEYLQLTVEDDSSSVNRQLQPLVRPYTILEPVQSWTEEEERRRVFWTIFNLDRYCSVTMGWNTSLTSHDVNRRLPCDGITWRKETPAETPFFGIWDKGSGRIGNPIAFLPSHHHPAPTHHPHPHPHHVENQTVTASSPTLSATDPNANTIANAIAQTPSNCGSSPSAAIDMTTVGAFAYSIEATESLSRVNTYFLQQRNTRDTRELHSWLTRFKELDLRLVHWKMFLPRKWKADNVTARSSPAARMDPNLTLAHVTHNASMILLHQVIAFPVPEWGGLRNRLPSELSVDTCRAAAAEIATIARNFLGSTQEGRETVLVPGQFSFCVYVAARFLLVFWRERGVSCSHSDHSGVSGASRVSGAGATDGVDNNGDNRALAPDFWALLNILDDMAGRWSGPRAHGFAFEGTSLAAKYAIRLRTLHARCVGDKEYHIDPLGYTTEIDHSTASGAVRTPPGARRETSNGPNPTADGDAQHATTTQGTQGTQPQQPLHAGRGHWQPEMAAQTSRMPPQMQGTLPPHGIPAASATAYQLAQPPPPSGTEGLGVFPGDRGHRGSTGSGEVGMISQLLMDQQFLDLDRVINYDDGMFGSEFDDVTW